MADRTADSRERVVTLDQFKRFAVFALACHLDIALDGDVQRTCRLTGSGTGRPGLDHAVFIFIVPVPSVFPPDMIIGKILLRILNLTMFCAQLLAEPDSAGRTYFHAFAAGDALFGVHLGNISRAGHVRRIEKLGGAECIADTDCAVAQAEDLVLTVNVGDLVDVAFLLGFMEDVQSFFVCDVVSHTGLAAVVSEIADTDAPVLFDVTGTLAADPLLLPAGTDADADMAFVFLQPVGQMLNVEGFTVGRNCLLDRNDMHADSGASGRYHLCDSRKGQVGHALEEISDLRGHR